ncbi:dipeptidase [Maribacter sp. 2307ULW6-5]|uniref:dipeptidase n=1 Tax=Maribacter sp. 2307ULW6-5 TaxID=3386275 RepID=UPI0039BD398A
MSPFIFDAHLDLSMNAMEWNRDLRWPVAQIRESEKGMTDKPDRGRNTVSFPAMRKGNIGLCVATQIARYVHTDNALPGWNSAQQAWAQTQGQWAWYKSMETCGALRQITDKQGLQAHLGAWEKDPENTPIGYILSLEGADSILDMEHLHRSHAQGLRAIGPAHYGPGTYAHGTDSTGGLGRKGKELLREMGKLNLILDATHLCDESFWEAMDVYQGPVWASHNNCRALVDHNRQFTDAQLRELIEWEAVVGMALDAWMMVPHWQRGVSHPSNTAVRLEHAVQHLDHICQLAGNTKHVGIGTDLDGGFGTEQTAADLDTIADLQKLPQLLRDRGYTEEDIKAILHGNFLAFLNRAWA